MKLQSLKWGVFVGLSLGSMQVGADPCGMVPPIHVDRNDPGIARVGAQRTYVMFKDGVETMVLRPGFEGSVDEFGMLIPFPTPPAIRKIDDDTFAQIEAAVDPPELTVRIEKMRRPLARSSKGMGMVASAEPEMSEEGLEFDEVRVLNQEAVGMYQVAVLEAGSPKALSKWMSENGFRYPEGMDEVVKDYVDIRWCFLAVKAKVGSAGAVEPKPGMRNANPDLPAGASFDGHVQGMGFRFKTPEPVVPMRLSVFNGADPRNVVYLLAEKGMALKGAPKELVVRQVAGSELYDHLTLPIPIKVEGGTLEGASPNEIKRIRERRDPDQYNGIARELFAADMLAVEKGVLALHFEEEEKALLNISEALNLRGDSIDGLLHASIKEQRLEAIAGSVADLSEMTLTVLDGVIPGELLASENLQFEPWTMPKKRNKPRSDGIRPVAGQIVFWR